MAELIPSIIPDQPEDLAPPMTDEADPSSQYDLAIGGIPFVYSNTPNNPMVRETVPPEKSRVDQARTPGENTLTSWWIRSQDSFHGGAGQLQSEPAVPSPFDPVRYDISKNVDVSVPGRVTSLPDTFVVTSDSALAVVTVAVAGVDAIVYLKSGGDVDIVINPADDTPTLDTFSAVSGILALATDGQSVFAADDTSVFLLDPTDTSASVTLASWPATATNVVLGWAKSRLMAGVGGAVFEIDITQSAVMLTGPDALYTHPSAGFIWRAFSVSPTAVLGAGDAFGESSITQFQVANVSGAPVLQTLGQIATMPIGERILSIVNSQGTFLIVGTTKGIRVGTFDSYFGALVLGPLELDSSQPTIPAYALATRDRFVFAAGLDFDEGGLLRVDLGSKVTQDGRFAWSPDLICPVETVTPANAVATLPVSGLLVFSVPGTGVLMEGVGAGAGRESWIRTSRIRYSTTEPKVFKLGRVRGDLTSGEIRVTAINPTSTDFLITVGFTLKDPDEFRLQPGLAEWMQLRLDILGDSTSITSYQVKALPGSRRQRHFQFVVSVNDRETMRGGGQVINRLSSRGRLAAIEALDAVGDEVVLQEFTPTGVISTRVVIESLSFRQTGRPRDTSDIGGDLTVLLRTVES